MTVNALSADDCEDDNNPILCAQHSIDPSVAGRSVCGRVLVVFVDTRRGNSSRNPGFFRSIPLKGNCHCHRQHRSHSLWRGFPRLGARERFAVTVNVAVHRVQSSNS